MKKSIIYLLFVFAVCALSTDMVFAQSTVTPIVDVPIGLEGDPPVGVGIPNVKTDVNGKFACKLPEGKYKLMLSYNDIASKVSRIDKNYASKPGGYEIDLNFAGLTANLWIFDRWGNRIKANAKVIINKETGVISITANKGGGTLSGTLTYTKVR